MKFSAAAVLCALVAASLYANTLDCGMCFDDETAIIDNKDLRPETPWSNLLWNDFWGVPMQSSDSHKSYRPLCVATFRLNYLIHELEPMGYHLVNVLLHSAVCYLYVLLCGVIFGDVWPALIAGLLFAVHPIHTEAVAGLVGRADVLSGLFFLGSLLCYGKAASHHGYKWMAITLLLCLFSSLSKEQGITAVAVCVVYDVFILHEMDVKSVVKSLQTSKKFSKSLKQILWRSLILAVFAASFMVFRLQLMQHAPIFPMTLNPALTLTTPYRQFHWLYLCFYNSWLLLVPSQLCPEYAMGTIPLITTVTDTRNLATVLTFTIVLGLGVYSFCGRQKRQRITVFATSLVVLSYLPASNLFFPVGFVVAERVLYIPSMGFCLLVGNGIWCILNRLKRTRFFVKLLVAFLLVTHCGKTLVRNRDWLSEFTLYHSAVTAMPSNSKMLHNLGTSYAKVKEYSKAVELFRAAVEIEPMYITALSDMGATLLKLKKTSEAEQVYRVAIDLINRWRGGGQSVTVFAKDMNVYTRLAAIIKLNSSRLEEAYDLCQTVILAIPRHLKAHTEMADILLKMNRIQEARSTIEKALQIDPNSPHAHYEMGLLQEKLGERQKAEQWYRGAMLHGGYFSMVLVRLASVLEETKEMKQLQEAEQLLLAVLKSEPESSDANFILGLIYYDLHFTKKAEDLFLTSLRLLPTNKDALYHVGKLYVESEKYDEAVKYLSELAQVHPKHVEGLYLLGKCYWQLKDVKRAQEVFEVVLMDNPVHVDAMYSLGLLEAEQGNMAKAIGLLTQVTEVDPMHKQAHVLLSRLSGN